MFTGLVQDVGVVQSVRINQQGSTLELKTHMDTSDWELGESVAVNGACLTVTHVKGQSFTVDCSLETLRCTTLGALKAHSKVHLERALQLGDRLGGHLVSGHVDGLGTVLSVRPEGNAIRIDIQPPEELLKYMINKGSITLDGVSLTINTLETKSFSVAIIPHTQEMTHLGEYQVGTHINLEVDQIGKYIERLTMPWKTTASSTSLDEAFLKEHGFG